MGRGEHAFGNGPTIAGDHFLNGLFEKAEGRKDVVLGQGGVRGVGGGGL